MTNYTTTIKDTNGNDLEITASRINNDTNGNPRYVVHYLSLGLKTYEAGELTRKAGIKKYNGKSFGGGFVFQSYNIKDDLQFVYNTINA